MTRTKPVAMKDPARIPAGKLFPQERIRALKTRGKARILSQLCIACGDIASCDLGRRLENIYRQVCQPQVGNDFRHCAKCVHTLERTCAIDRASLAEALHEQLGVCTLKRGFDMPLAIVRWDVLFRGSPAALPERSES